MIDYPIEIKKNSDDEWIIIEQGCGCCEEEHTIDEDSKEDVEKLIKYLNEQLQKCQYVLDNIINKS